MTRITTHIATEPLPYTGPELQPHFVLRKFGVRGSALAAFRGPCKVETEHMVDWEDRLASDRIEAREMLHFLGEFFGASLREGVLWQRLLMATLAETLNPRLVASGKALLRREGDDLFFGERKLSVSIVTASPVSQLLHIGINIDPTGAPVPAIGLAELGVMPELWLPGFMKAVEAEAESLDWACAKVRPVV